MPETSPRVTYDFSSSSDDELSSRLGRVVGELESLARQVCPLLVRAGHMRGEIVAICAELEKRGVHTVA